MWTLCMFNTWYKFDQIINHQWIIYLNTSELSLPKLNQLVWVWKLIWTTLNIYRFSRLECTNVKGILKVDWSYFKLNWFSNTLNDGHSTFSPNHYPCNFYLRSTLRYENPSHSLSITHPCFWVSSYAINLLPRRF